MIIEQFWNEDSLISLSHFPGDIRELKDTLPAWCYDLHSKKFQVSNEQVLKQRLGTYWTLCKLIEGKFELKHLSSGKPLLNNTNISISHTSDFVAIITNPSKSVGIDIELRSRDASKVIERVSTENEKKFLKEKKYSKDIALLLWCAKETIFKMLDIEDSEGMKNIEVVPFEIIPLLEDTRMAVWGKFHEASLNALWNSTIYKVHYRITKEFILCWASS